jgi:nucleotide-binding universal stress UspA family protein
VGSTREQEPLPPPPQLFRKLLVAIDTGPHPPKFRRAIQEFAHPLGTEVVVCHVVMRSTSVVGNESDGAPANPEEVAILASLRGLLVQDLGERGHRFPIKILHGDPGQRISEYADFAGCDLIILEARERTLAQRLRGNVAKYVAGASKRSVLIIGE